MQPVFMTWINIFAVALVFGYALWVVWQGWQLFANLLRANTANEVLKNILEQRRFYFTQGTVSLTALTLFLGIKALLLLLNCAVENIFSIIVFGDFANRFLPGKVGCLGLVLAVIFLVCFYQYLKSKHYLEVLYALRHQLGLPEPRRVSSEPAMTAIAERRAL